MKIEFTLTTKHSFRLDESKLLDYAREVRERFGAKPDDTVWMYDIMVQAQLDGDLGEFEEGDINLPDWEEELADADLKELMET